MSRKLNFRHSGALLAMVALGGCGEPLVQFFEHPPDMTPSPVLNDMTGLTVDQAHPRDMVIPPGADMAGFDLSLPDLPQLDMLGIDLKIPAPDMLGVDLLGADMLQVDLQGVDMLALDLKGVDMLGLDLQGVDMLGVDLQGADMLGVDLLGVDMQGVDLRAPATDMLADLNVQPDLVGADLTLPTPDMLGVDLSLADSSVAPDMTPGMSSSRCPSVLFDGAMAIVTAPAIAALNPTSDVTVEAWVYPTANGGEMIIAGHTGDPAMATASYYLGIDAGGHAFFTTSSTGATLNVATGTSIVPLNKWTQVAGEFDATNLRVIVYVAGQPEGQASPVAVGPKSIANVPLHIGRYSAVTPIMSPFKGYIDEVRFSSVARYVAAYTPASFFAPDANTIALYHFNENSGQTAADSSTNANVGALQSNAMFASAPLCQ